jgi:hypothetical protein
MRSHLYLIGLILVLGYKPYGQHPLTLWFSHMVGDLPLELSTTTYRNAFGEPFSVGQCKYYISNIRITGEDGSTQTILAGSHLVDAADTTTLTLQTTTTITKITTIRFDIGVDSLANQGGVHTGDLDPMLGMFWTWNTGYIDARLEGRSDSAHAPAHRFTWDVGGYRPGEDAKREVYLKTPELKNNLTIRIDLLRWFDGKHPIHLSQSPVCHQPCPLATQLADNYSTSFSIAR